MNMPSQAKDGSGDNLLSDHFDGNRFFTPGIQADKGWRDLWRWRRTREHSPWPSHLDIPSFPSRRIRSIPATSSSPILGMRRYLYKQLAAISLRTRFFRNGPALFPGWGHDG